MRSSIEVSLVRTLEADAKDAGFRDMKCWRDQEGDFFLAFSFSKLMFEDNEFDGILRCARDGRRQGVAALRYAEWIERAPHQLFAVTAGKVRRIATRKI